MRFYFTARIAALAGSLLFGLGCASAAATQPLTVPLSGGAVADGSALCDGIIDRFLGLPAGLDEDAEAGTSGPALAGRWWIRGCSARRAGGELRLHLEGPGWYWVEDHDNGVSVQQQVPFSLSLELDNRVEAGSRDGVFSLWLVPVREPRVQLTLTEKPAVRSSNAWGTMLGLVLPLRSLAAERIADSASSSLREQLRAGVTLTYDFQSGNADATVGRLAEGETPRHPFQGDAAWVINDRLALAPTSTQVVGPLEPGTSRMDIRVERGSGVAYRAVCAQDMTSYYGVIASGRLGEIPRRAVHAAGVVSGTGDHETELRVEGCRYYLVLSAWKDHPTVAALRVRA